mmetsp:Transcript_26504/g.48030  ORF Transcript_26504/g.48030 Transcript_26504/m.48030 type:complete len:212 (+) Transcript_26504:210-845(+)
MIIAPNNLRIFSWENKSDSMPWYSLVTSLFFQKNPRSPTQDPHLLQPLHVILRERHLPHHCRKGVRRGRSHRHPILSHDPIHHLIHVVIVSRHGIDEGVDPAHHSAMEQGTVDRVRDGSFSNFPRGGAAGWRRRGGRSMALFAVVVQALGKDLFQHHVPHCVSQRHHLIGIILHVIEDGIHQTRTQRFLPAKCLQPLRDHQFHQVGRCARQ